jgi:2'-5' RNA ligase
MRLFAALDLPAEVCGALHAWWGTASAAYSPSVWRHVPPHSLHLTLAFFGEVPGGDTAALAEALGACAARQGPLQLALDGFGAFPSLSRPRAFWAGVADVGHADGSLPRLARCCRLAGHATVRKRPAQDTPFRGHVTLARASQAAAIGAEVLAAMPPLPELAWTAGTLLLIQSMLRPDGARYRILEDFPLGE